MYYASCVSPVFVIEGFAIAGYFPQKYLINQEDML
jgi:hypothetical protein